MSSEPYIAKPIENARDAIASHIRWKITLLTAARLREPLSERAKRSIEQPGECAIRRWLLSDHTLSLRGTREFTAILERHLAFHREMQHIAVLLHSGLYAEAEQQLRNHTSFEHASIALANALMTLDRLRTDHWSAKPAAPLSAQRPSPLLR